MNTTEQKEAEAVINMQAKITELTKAYEEQGKELGRLNNTVIHNRAEDMELKERLKTALELSKINREIGKDRIADLQQELAAEKDKRTELVKSINRLGLLVKRLEIEKLVRVVHHPQGEHLEGGGYAENAWDEYIYEAEAK